MVGPFTITHSRHQVVDFSAVFMIDTSPFILPFETEVDIFGLIRPFKFEAWIVVQLAPPIYCIVMGLLDLIFNGKILWLNWESLMGFVYRHLIRQPHQLGLSQIYNSILTLNWVVGAFVITTLYAGKCFQIIINKLHVKLFILFAGLLTGMLTKPTPPDLINSVEELVNQEKVGYFIEIGARNENLGKSSPPGSTLKYDLIAG